MIQAKSQRLFKQSNGSEWIKSFKIVIRLHIIEKESRTCPSLTRIDAHEINSVVVVVVEARD